MLMHRTGMKVNQLIFIKLSKNEKYYVNINYIHLFSPFTLIFPFFFFFYHRSINLVSLLSNFSLVLFSALFSVLALASTLIPITLTLQPCLKRFCLPVFQAPLSHLIPSFQFSFIHSSLLFIFCLYIYPLHFPHFLTISKILEVTVFN